MTLPAEIVRHVRCLDEHQLRRLGILVRGLLLDREGPEPAPDPTLPSDLRYRQTHVRCGKDCRACPHGPYWYAHWREGGRARSQYIGRELSADVRRLLDAADDQSLSGVGD